MLNQQDAGQEVLAVPRRINWLKVLNCICVNSWIAICLFCGLYSWIKGVSAFALLVDPWLLTILPLPIFPWLTLIGAVLLLAEITYFIIIITRGPGALTQAFFLPPSSLPTLPPTPHSLPMPSDSLNVNERPPLSGFFEKKILGSIEEKIFKTKLITTRPALPSTMLSDAIELSSNRILCWGHDPHGRGLCQAFILDTQTATLVTFKFETRFYRNWTPLTSMGNGYVLVLDRNYVINVLNTKNVDDPAVETPEALKKERYSAFAVLPNGNLATKTFSAGNDKCSIIIWNTQTWKSIYQSEACFKNSDFLMAVTNNHLVAFDDYALAIWNLEKNTIKHCTRPAPNHPVILAGQVYLAEENKIGWINQWAFTGMRVEIIDLTTGECVKSKKYTFDHLRTVRPLPTGDLLVYYGESGNGFFAILDAQSDSITVRNRIVLDNDIFRRDMPLILLKSGEVLLIDIPAIHFYEIASIRAASKSFGQQKESLKKYSPIPNDLHSIVMSYLWRLPENNSKAFGPSITIQESDENVEDSEEQKIGAEHH